MRIEKQIRIAEEDFMSQKFQENLRRKTMTYLQGKAVGGASYSLYSNVASTNSYPVNVGGVWCP